MTYKTILVHIDDTSRSPSRIQLAAQLAMKQDAHLLAIADTGVSRFIYQDGNINGVDPSLLSHLEYLRERATQNVVDFKIQAAKLGVTSFSSEITQDDACGGIGLRARYCDLVIVGQTNPDEASPAVMDDFPEYMILNSGRPVLIIPYAGDFNQPGKRPLIAWDGSRAATRAITDAIPLLRTADLVNVAIVNPKGDTHGEQPGADIAAYLARHGIKLDVSVHNTKLNTGNALLSLASDLNSDLMVMGGYGHSRFREMIMGGATRTILESMTIPTLMSH
ncbi:universal stress protein [Solimicrobium silvestre]|uniref:Universal stress protein family n=1 Tax=Solimicrobium silvestre TaxID=2099400 RepID=A0A2S9GVC0_9BURK|nr:universal stress protein [Solimicrobium silvestre]PRC91675.1 Universal stress protein family [Solimicrobium silvestre]